MTDSLFPAGSEAVLPILPLRNSVLFPASVVPVNVGRSRSVRLIDQACNHDRPVLGVVAQRRPDTEDPTFDELHEVGTLARVLKVIRLGSGNYSVVLQGISRMRIVEGTERHPYLKARVLRLPEPLVVDPSIDQLAVELRKAHDALVAAMPPQNRAVNSSIENVREAGALSDLVVNGLGIGNDVKQLILETLDVRTRLEKVLDQVRRQSDVLRVRREISDLVEGELHKSQRELLLRQQMKSIRRELGESEDDEEEIDSLREKVVRLELPEEAAKAAKRELRRMVNMPSSGNEYQVARAYVEWLLDLPWNRLSADRMSVAEARRVLDEDHFGLEKAKKRLLEYVAVRKLRKDGRAPILCFVGPPGVGKTSLAKSIARASGRQLARMSLGGVADESEIRGHRRTYVGAFPGRVLGALKKAGTRNPVLVLDEIDKLGRDNRGDPASALLEVLDPEQNREFVDHYVDVPFDLSQVMFIATANRKDTIPAPLFDRMEVIEIPGYTRDEKRAIARQYLVPKQLSEHGLSPNRLDFSDSAIHTLVDEHTNEAGVRRLEQQIASICRAVAVRVAAGEDVQVVADAGFVREVLGPPRRNRQMVEKKPRPGVATGLVWTPAGGEILLVEATRVPGTGKVQLTGSVGDVMKESAATAFSYLRSRAATFGLPADFLSKIDVHVHLPEGALPKDGPSSGLTMLVALASMMTRMVPRADTASTGEITLRGHVLRVTGIKEKCLAAHRAGIERVLIPRDNEADLDEVPEEVRKALDIRLVSRMDEALSLALAEPIGASASPVC